MSIILNNISKVYSMQSGINTVLAPLSVKMETGQIHVILGESGQGKTTLLRLIAGLEKPTTGHMDIQHQSLGYVFQEPRLLPWLTVEENITFPVLQKKLRNHSWKEEILEMLGIEKIRASYPDMLSTGMAKRVSIGRTLFANPDILLIDEPFSNLDYFTKNALYKDFLNIQSSLFKTVVLVTHDIDEALLIGNIIWVIKKGQLQLLYTLPSYELREPLLLHEYKQTILNVIKTT